MENLASQFAQRLPGGISYSDAELLCFWLFLTAEGIPAVFTSAAYTPRFGRYICRACTLWLDSSEHRAFAYHGE